MSSIKYNTVSNDHLRFEDDSQTIQVMPTITLHPPDPVRGSNTNSENPLPQLLQTPSGLAILELQGTINVPSTPEENSPSSHPAATKVGQLIFPDYNPDDPTGSTAWMKRVHLYIGRHQRLTGEVKKLATPLGVIRRKSVQADAMIEDAEQLEIMEIVYYKVLFSSRPEPVGE